MDKLKRFVCIHGHFYQPPRENPWLEMVELQDSAYPFHDWNDRITAECYAPNAVARILGSGGKISRLANNYSRISFNFGPTLLAWMLENAPDVYERVLDADRESQDRFGGHGSALAQVYNHLIMPLANERDKLTQVIWGIRDFKRRFGREPEGMWLAETAVDLATLDVLAAHGIRFTILAPNQASRARRLGSKDWKDVSGSRIDPAIAYLQKLPSGRTISLFFYDGPVSQAVAFEKLLFRGESLANRLCSAFSDHREGSQLVHIATDGESYGHHHAHGDMALAYALDVIEAKPDLRLTNYGEFLELAPPEWEVEIFENSSWSCVHGVERWRSSCGCNSGRAGWHQEWRGPLREALDGLRDVVAPLFERQAGALFKEPWATRNDYIDLLLDRSPATLDRFFRRHSRKTLTSWQRTLALKLLELQRHALLMYTSCGWFFDEVSGIETVQILMYAARVIQLGEELFDTPLEIAFLDALARAPSNLPAIHPSALEVYQKCVQPARLDWHDIAAHYAVASLFQSFEETSHVFCYDVVQEDLKMREAGKVKLAVGHARLISEVTQESWHFAFASLHLGDHNVNAGVVEYPGDEAYQAIAAGFEAAFEQVDTPLILRLMDRAFGESSYSIASLFRDLQRHVIKNFLREGLAETTGLYRRVFEQNAPLMRFLQLLSAPMPLPFQATAEVLFNTDLDWALKDDDLNFDQIQRMVKDAGSWDVKLDTKGLSYKFTKMLDRCATRWGHHPEQIELMETLARGVAMTAHLPFEPNLWSPQNVFFDVEVDHYEGMLTAALSSDETAANWVEQFLKLGDSLGVDTVPLRKKWEDQEERPGIADLVDECMAGRYVPLATYRLQLNAQFPLTEATQVVDYLADLGISDVYASPILQARPGSMHGYDICDHSRINTELGGEAALAAFSQALKGRGMGIVLDVVPNHMSVGHSSNLWWADVLEHGASSRYASTFDIDWQPINPDLKDKVLLPVLGEQYGRTLETGQLKLRYEGGSFHISYYGTRLPVAPMSYIAILSSQLHDLTRKLGDEDEHLLEYRSIITAIGHLPPRTGVPAEHQAERYREVAIVKRRLAALEEASREVRTAIDEAVAHFNGNVGSPNSFDEIDRLIGEQSYRPAFWRVAIDEINYRRFFDIDDLAAIRVEDHRVFEATHEVIFRLLEQGVARGLRIDHPDGLYCPSRYFRDVQERFLLDELRRTLGDDALPFQTRGQAISLLRAKMAKGKPGPLYVVAEKILGDQEPLPRDWMIDGTTGYDFLNACNRLFVRADGLVALDAVYSRITGQSIEVGSLVRACKQVIMQTSMASEINTLSHQLDRITERNRHYRDFTLTNLRFALREFISSLAIYRTYTAPDGIVSERDAQFVEAALDEAKLLNPRTTDDIFDFIRDIVLLRNLDQFPVADRPHILDWVLRFQQVTGPIMAKGIEDTAFYVYNRLISLNEVGGHPEKTDDSVDEFHRINAEHAAHWPASMLSSSTHDTKRSEDVRARINVLSELVAEWEKLVPRWLAETAEGLSQVDGQSAPTRNDQYLLFQTLVGTWPDPAPVTSQEISEYRDRIIQYMEKATKEAKKHTSWVNPNEEYDEAVRKFVTFVLDDLKETPFARSFLPFARKLAFFGRFNSLAQTCLKLTSPGVPDIYQGMEMWDFGLVDPDNRRPVDYPTRIQALETLRPLLAGKDADSVARAGELLTEAVDGRIKLYLTARLLQHRRQHPAIFQTGDYQAIPPTGAQADATCAFMRREGQHMLVTAACIQPVKVTRGRVVAPLGEVAWSDTFFPLPGACPQDRFLDILTRRVLTPQNGPDGTPGLFAKDVFDALPVAVLQRELS